MAALQLQDVFEPYYAGKEAARSGPLDAVKSGGDTATDDRAESRRHRLDMAEKRFARALSRLPGRDR